MEDVLPKPLSLEEKKYLLAVRRGDLTNVRRLIHKAYRSQSIDINCVDSLGRGSLNLAIDSENLEMVELLIVMGVNPKDALLHAIDAEFVEAVEMLLEYEEIIYKDGDKYSWEKVDRNTSTFTPDITPLMLAAHKNNFEILKTLLDRGAALPVPHRIGCPCDGCVHESKMDSLRHSMSRVNVYRALSSPSLISLSCNDPILTAFKLSWELRMLSREEKECQREYTELRYQCQQFAVDLLDQTRSSEELAIILNHDSETNVKSYTTPEFVKLRKLELAIKYRQKRFIAHPHVQQLLSKIWYDGLPGFRSKTLVSKSIAIVQIAIIFPLYCLAYMIAPNSKLGLAIIKPVIKFLMHTTSYFLFLGILILVSQRAEVQIIELLGTEEMKIHLKESLRKQRGNPPTILEWVVLIYVVGYIKEEWREIQLLGLKDYLKNSMWNLLQFVKICTYMMVMVLRLYAYARERFEIQNEPSMAFVPRHEWHMFDPQLIAEGLFALANIGSALKLIHIFSVNSHLGPLQISLGRMVIDIVKFFSIYVLVLFSFACGLNQLLWYYANLEREKCYVLPDGSADWENSSESCTKWRRFGNLFESIQTLFWTGFGEAGLDSFDLTGINPYTRFWGLMTFGIYCVINVTVLLNLLIAMMSNSYSVIEGQSDMEWKFSRTKLWMTCLEGMPVLPSPFNMMPYTTIRDLCCVCFGKVYPRLKNSMRNQSTADINLRIKAEHLKYLKVMRALVWRYIGHKHRKSEQTLITEDHIQEVKSDISSFKYELLEILGKSGMEVHSEEDKRDRVLSKKLRIWERQLMKDFHLGLIKRDESIDTFPDGMTKSRSGSTSYPGTEESKFEQESPSDQFRREACLNKFRTIAKNVVYNSSSNKWKRTIDEARKASQIGQCKTEESLMKQKKLMKAMTEARIMVSASPTTPTAGMTPFPYTLPPSRPSLLNLMKPASNVENDVNSGEDHDK